MNKFIRLLRLIAFFVVSLFVLTSLGQLATPTFAKSKSSKRYHRSNSRHVSHRRSRHARKAKVVNIAKGPVLDLPDNERDFIAKKGSRIYHYADCDIACDIPVLMRVGFYSHQMARRNKMKLCPICAERELGIVPESKKKKSVVVPSQGAGRQLGSGGLPSDFSGGFNRGNVPESRESKYQDTDEMRQHRTDPMRQQSEERTNEQRRKSQAGDWSRSHPGQAGNPFGSQF